MKSHNSSMSPQHPANGYDTLFHLNSGRILTTRISKIHFNNILSAANTISEAAKVKFRSIYFFVRFEVLTAVTMKNAVFWDVALCRYCVNRRFGGTYRLHQQGRKIRQRGTSVSRWLQTATSQKTAFFIYLLFSFPSHPFKCPLFRPITKLFGSELAAGFGI
jgi:hypothetical protein